MEKWAFEENEALGISPDKITTGSNKKVWWRCLAEQHLYQRDVFLEATRNFMCPVCKKENKKYVANKTDLMEKWAFKENEALGISPDKITTGSHKKVWWRCLAEHHLYLRTISTEATRNPQCPVCKKENKKYVANETDLMEKWAFEENDALGISPYQVTTGSGKKVWWRCSEKQHLYQRHIDKEAIRKPQCPICRKESKKHLSSERPDLLEKWAFEENEALGISPYHITIGSNKKVWWRCSAVNHLYLREISTEATRNPQCPVCKKENQKYLSDYPELLKEFAYDLNDVKPEELTAGSDTRVKWRCKEYGHVWVTAPYHRIKEMTRCPYCSNKKLLQGFNDLLTINPHNLRYWDYERNGNYGIFASNYLPSSKQKAWWICDKGHHSYESINKVISRKATPCSECLKEKKEASTIAAAEKKKRQDAYAKRRENVRMREIAKMMAKQESLLEKQAFARSAAKKKKQQEQAKRERAKQEQAKQEQAKQEQAKQEQAKQEQAKREQAKREQAKREQAKREQAKREQAKREQKALVEKQKKWWEIVNVVARFWDFDENIKRGFKLEEVTRKRVYCWKCSKDHKWKSDLNKMINNPKCPECFKEENSISKKYPYLSNIYDIEMNGGIPPEKCFAMDSRYYWWTCQKGHTFIATLACVAKHKETGCMYCDGKKPFYSL